MKAEKIITKDISTNLIKAAELSGKEPEKIFGKYIFRNEICALFGDENSGKSILAHDIAVMCSSDVSYWPEDHQPGVIIPTMLVDLEMTDSQYAMRYRGASAYITKDLVRARVEVTGGSSKEIIDAISCEIIKTQKRPKPIKLLIIDNITYAMDSLHNTKEMKVMFRLLKELVKRFDITIIIVAHCIKRKPGTMITSNDMGGSKVIMNFVDSAIAVGTSVLGDEVKYLKHIKARMAPKMKEVRTLEISKDPYLHFEPKDLVEEEEHLKAGRGWNYARSSIKPEMEPEIIEMREEGMTYNEIADHFGISKSAVGRYCQYKGI